MSFTSFFAYLFYHLLWLKASNITYKISFIRVVSICPFLPCWSSPRREHANQIHKGKRRIVKPLIRAQERLQARRVGGGGGTATSSTPTSPDTQAPSPARQPPQVSGSTCNIHIHKVSLFHSRYNYKYTNSSSYFFPSFHLFLFPNNTNPRFSV